MKRLMTLSVAAVVLCACNAPRQPETVVFHSDNLHCDDTVLVYTPARQVLECGIPNVFLLHGYSGNYTDWSRHMDLQELADRTGFRVICPDGFYASWYFNNADPAKMQWRTFFWEELWPDFSAKYGFKPEETFITGLSMGGGGAMNIFLDRPDLFRAGASMSGVLDLACSATFVNSISELLGGTGIEDPRVRTESAVSRIGRIREICGEEAAQDKWMIATCGYDDYLLKATQNFNARCRELGVQHIEMYSPAAHTWEYWTWVVNEHINLFTEILEGSKLGKK